MIALTDNAVAAARPLFHAPANRRVSRHGRGLRLRRVQIPMGLAFAFVMWL